MITLDTRLILNWCRVQRVYAGFEGASRALKQLPLLYCCRVYWIVLTLSNREETGTGKVWECGSRPSRFGSLGQE